LVGKKKKFKVFGGAVAPPLGVGQHVGLPMELFSAALESSSSDLSNGPINWPIGRLWWHMAAHARAMCGGACDSCWRRSFYLSIDLYLASSIPKLFF
jgi:hypothetical protein